jgi:hypothetical protein
MDAPEPVTVKVPLLKPAPPANATEPTSPSHHPAGSGEVAIVMVRVMDVVCIRLPAVPVTVAVKPPVGAVLLAAKASVLVPEVLAGVNEAFTPLGNPDAVRLTLPVKPFWGVIVIMLVPLDPCVRLTVFGDADSAKFGTALTVRVIVVEPVRLPEVPVIVTLVVPAVAALLAESVSVLVVEALPGVKDAVTPVGSPEADMTTVPLNPPRGTMLMVLVPLVPCTSVMLFGEAERLKPRIGLTPGQLLSKFNALIEPIPVAKSHPVVVP